jgi:DNA-binding CsgD family transcriptional regulator
MRACEAASVFSAAATNSNIGMFDVLLMHLLRAASTLSDRREGVAFFRAAMTVYALDEMAYFCFNVPVSLADKRYAHCIYSNRRVTHCASEKQLDPKIIEESGLKPGICNELHELSEDQVNGRGLTLPIRQRLGELAAFGVRTKMDIREWETKKKSLVSEVAILANYFHGHALRMNGFNSDRDLLVSARELDCLQWTAAGKTAWEASVILGISERTVRFHLNAAREKLNCATTTQAVAKAISYQLINL